jgi:hypothetical protein
MESLDERVAYLEGRMEDHTALMADIRADLRELRSEIRADMNRFDQKIDRHFMWLAGILVGVLTALAGLAIQVARLKPL